jgi:hypothetical protein
MGNEIQLHAPRRMWDARFEIMPAKQFHSRHRDPFGNRAAEIGAGSGTSWSPEVRG